jgi:hypothetical protein
MSKIFQLANNQIKLNIRVNKRDMRTKKDFIKRVLEYGVKKLNFNLLFYFWFNQ